MENKMKRLVLAFVLMVTLLTAYGTKAQAASEPPRCKEFEPLLEKYRLPVRQFSFYMWSESRCTVRVIGWNYRPGKSKKDCRPAPASQYKRCKAVGSYDSGLLQINSSWKTLTSQICRSKYGDLTVLLRPDCNVRVAAFLWHKGGGAYNWRGSTKSWCLWQKNCQVAKSAP